MAGWSEAVSLDVAVGKLGVDIGGALGGCKAGRTQLMAGTGGGGGWMQGKYHPEPTQSSCRWPFETKKSYKMRFFWQSFRIDVQWIAVNSSTTRKGPLAVAVRWS